MRRQRRRVLDPVVPRSRFARTRAPRSGLARHADLRATTDCGSTIFEVPRLSPLVGGVLLSGRSTTERITCRTDRRLTMSQVASLSMCGQRAAAA